MFRDYTNYDVLEDGRIWSKKHKKFLKPINRKNGYQQVCLYDNEGKKHYELLHKVVYFAVNGLWEYPEGMQINHLNESKTSNEISNLELVTPKQNTNFGTRNARAAKALSKAMKGNTNSPQKRVGAFKNGELQMVYASTNEAGRQGFNQGAVSACCRNCFNREGNNKYKGYEWRYLDEE